MQSKLYTEVGYYVREKIDRRVPLKDFLDYSSVSVPVNLEEGKSRIVINYGAMGGNYLVVFGVLLCLFLVLHPALIIPIGICFGLLYIATENDSESINIMGNELKKLHLYCVAVGVPVLFFIFMPSSLVSLFFTLALSILLCIGHMVIYKPPANANEEHI
ncbi:PRA1 family protein 1 [Nematocida minor]|uniref:PRA1 family protein 1 n=1 Tax=Nematocida minor TaxID=1912983 RepID=UPI00221EE9F2|nr:PRA1 family protein 1 [Nematocida minor]KAI5191699.1 PRA1 family protein 1 [Nematocida minor]